MSVGNIRRLLGTHRDTLSSDEHALFLHVAQQLPRITPGEKDWSAFTGACRVEPRREVDEVSRHHNVGRASLAYVVL